MNTQQLDHTYIANTYARYPVTIVRGKGSLVWDENGKEYIDLATGIAVNSFGVSDPAWVRAVTEQLCTVQHTSNLYFTAPDAQLAQLLRNAGIVHARPGKNGGYSLAKDASEISMLDIFNALQNDRLRAERKEAEESVSALLKNITAACSAVEREMEEYMSSITLQNMIERIRDKESDSATRSQTPA
mgnify:CR=1 FL=1